MKRSQINYLIEESIDFFNENNFKLPPWAYWKPEDWKGKWDECREIVDNMLGWDLTDFGSGDFFRKGLILFTLRNGNTKRDEKIYAEKIMIVDEQQETPLHFHWSKMEDIINRGGGNLVMELFCSTPTEEVDEDSIVEVKINSIVRKYRPGEKVFLYPGESICLTRRLYHRFYGEQGKGKVLVGEVSAVNNDYTDNKFNPEIGRFASIEEDVFPLHLLANEVEKYL